MSQYFKMIIHDKIYQNNYKSDSDKSDCTYFKLNSKLLVEPRKSSASHSFFLTDFRETQNG